MHTIFVSKGAFYVIFLSMLEELLFLYHVGFYETRIISCIPSSGVITEVSCIPVPFAVICNNNNRMYNGLVSLVLVGCGGFWVFTRKVRRSVHKCRPLDFTEPKPAALNSHYRFFPPFSFQGTDENLLAVLTERRCNWFSKWFITGNLAEHSAFDV
jgi:hypothetical protein